MQGDALADGAYDTREVFNLLIRKKKVLTSSPQEINIQENASLKGLSDRVFAVQMEGETEFMFYN